MCSENVQTEIPGKHRQKPIFLFIPEDLAEVFAYSETEAVFVGSMKEGRCTEDL